MGSLSSLVMMTMLPAGCASSRDVRLADGLMAHVVSCGGRGYRILNATEGELPATPNAIPTGGLPHMPTSGLNEFAERKLFIKCN